MNSNLFNILEENILKYGSRKVFYSKIKGRWKGISWNELGSMVHNTAKALINYGVLEGDRIVIYSGNRPEWTIADYAIQAIRGVSVPIYSNTSLQQAKFIVEETEAAIILAGDQEQYDNAVEIAKNSKFIKKVVAFNPEIKLNNNPNSIYFSQLLSEGEKTSNEGILKDRKKGLNENDLLTIIYTSGTSGEPKGVMLHQFNLLHCIHIHKIRLKISDSDISLCFLPLSHIFERGWTYLAISTGMTVYYLQDPQEVVQTLAEVRPTLMCAVPRFFEKTYTAVNEKVKNYGSLKLKLYNWAMKTGGKHELYLRNATYEPLVQKFIYFVADNLVLKRGKAAFGGRIRFMPCAGATLSDEVLQFFLAAGLPIKYGYGLTESTATVSCFTDKNYKIGSVGKLMPGLEMKTGENNEIMLRGKTITTGYYKNPNATQAAFRDGWFCTGDAGHIDEEGNIYLIDRIKDIFKTSSGKFIAPQKIEKLLENSHFIEHAAVVGNQRKYVTALIVPNFKVLKEYAGFYGIQYHSPEELIRLPQIIQLYRSILEDTQKDLSSFEKIKKIRLLKNEFKVNEELTLTLKLKRKYILEKYQKEIEEMYL